MNIADLPDDSDTSDEDYVPSGNQENVPSEVESDGDSEEPLSETEDDTRAKKRKKKTSKTKKKVKNQPEESGNNSKENEHHQKETEEDKKKKVDDLWADFMKDTGFRPKSINNKQAVDLNSSKTKTNSTCVKENCTSMKQEPQKLSEKIKVTQIFEFAGEEVKVEKEVAVDSAEARLLNKTPNNDAAKTSKGKRSSGLGGISNVLSQLGKKPKISTLEKSKLDWDKFKKEENIEEELQIYNKGKDGYLDRQDFLQRADQRRFEIEKDLRTIERNKRFNSTL